MLFAEIIRVALEAINANKMRSMLTMLGIVIGVAAVITMVALGTGAQRAVNEQIERLGTNVLTVRAGQAWFRGARGGSARLTVEDAMAVAAGAASVEGVAPEMSSNMQIEFGRSNASVRVTGTTPNFVDINNYDIAAGRFFEERELDGRRRVAVLGGAVPAVLGTSALNLVGQKICISNNTFEVVGVLE